MITFSLPISIALFSGVTAIGWYALHLLRVEAILDQKYTFLQAPLIGLLLLHILLNPIALFGTNIAWVFRTFSWLLVVTGVLFPLHALWTKHKTDDLLQQAVHRLTESGFHAVLLGTLVVGFFLLSLAPVTNADSLDYHLGVPRLILETGSMPVVPYWFTSRLAGSGEVVNTLGVGIEAKQFAGAIQFAALLSLVGLLAGLHAPISRIGGGLRPHYLSNVTKGVVALSVPALAFLGSSAKPQLLPIAMTTLAMALLLRVRDHRSSPVVYRRTIVLVLFIAVSAPEMKYSFLLGGGLVGLMALLCGWRDGYLRFAFIVSLIAIGAVIAPPAAWRSVHFGGSLLEAVLHPFPGDLPGYDAFESYLRGHRDTPVFFPLSLVIPSSFGTTTTIIGPGVLVAFFVRPEKRFEHISLLGAVTVFLIAATVFGQRNSRFFLEAFYWLLLLPIGFTRKEVHRLATFGITLQAVVTLVFVWYGVVTLFPGSLTPQLRDKVMTRAANGYDVMRWADTELPAEAKVMSEHRSVALSPRPFVATDWMRYVGVETEEFDYYARMMNEEGITHVLATSAAPPPIALGLFTGDLVAGPFIGREATRNPFNRGKEYEAWLYTYSPHTEIE